MHGRQRHPPVVSVFFVLHLCGPAGISPEPPGLFRRGGRPWKRSSGVVEAKRRPRLCALTSPLHHDADMTVHAVVMPRCWSRLLTLSGLLLSEGRKGLFHCFMRSKKEPRQRSLKQHAPVEGESEWKLEEEKFNGRHGRVKQKVRNKRPTPFRIGTLRPRAILPR